MLDDLPPFLTVEQAAKVLQLGRSKAYELTVEWERSGGRAACPSSGSATRSASPAPPSCSSSRTTSAPRGLGRGLPTSVEPEVARSQATTTT